MCLVATTSLPNPTFQDFDCFTVNVGSTMRLRSDFDSLSEIKRMRHRLFKRAYAKSVNIRDVSIYFLNFLSGHQKNKIIQVNFNVVPMSFIEDLLQGVVFQVLWFIVKREEFNER